MEENENQFEDITESKSNTVTDEDNFKWVEEYLYLGEPDSAQAYLNCVNTTSARKCYLQSKIYKQKKWYNEQRKQLKKAIKLEPENEEYKRELDELNEFRKAGGFGKFGRNERKRQMGDAFGEGCAECCCAGTCECCAQGICEGLGSC